MHLERGIDGIQVHEPGTQVRYGKRDMRGKREGIAQGDRQNHTRLDMSIGATGRLDVLEIHTSGMNQTELRTTAECDAQAIRRVQIRTKRNTRMPCPEMPSRPWFGRFGQP